MSDGYDEDSEGKDTQILAGEQAPPLDLEGTVEMDREALFRRIQQHDRSRSDSSDSGDPPGDRAATVQMPSIDSTTTPSRTTPMPAVDGATQNFQVPDSVMRSLREHDDMNTLDIPLEAIEEARRPPPGHSETVPRDAELIEFASVVDESGRIAIPAAKLTGKVQPGTRVVVVMRLIED